MSQAVDPAGPEAPESLVRMANQIAANLDRAPHDAAVELLAAHLRDFWAPSMREELIEYVDAGGAGLTGMAIEALDRLR